MQGEINKVVALLNKGKVILYPTDTIWGLGCSAIDPIAIQRLKTIKERQKGKNLIILVSGIDMLKRYVTTVPEQAIEAMEKSPYPLTIIYPQAKKLPISLLSQDQSIGIRVPKNDFCQRLIATLDAPLVSTSANISSEPSPATFENISSTLRSRVDYIVPAIYEQKALHTASSILKIEADNSLTKIR